MEEDALQKYMEAPASTSSGPDSGSNGSWLDQLRKNRIFAAGAGMAGIGVGMAFLKTGFLQGMLLARKQFTVSLEIPSKDRSYQWVLQWISKHSASNSRHIGVDTSFKQKADGRILTSFDFVPSPGLHYIYYKRNLIQVIREREKSMIDLNSGTPWETVTLTALGRKRDVFSSILNEAKSLALQKEEGKTIIYTSMGPEWQQFGRPRKRRPLHSVILKQGLAEKIVNDVKEFSQSSAWYVDRGIPYRRGYLLHGPPGCGKSSFITALAGHLQYNICILNLNERGLTDDKLNVLLSVAPPRSFILLEDIDAAFVKRDAQSRQYSVTFSGLLNCLDGVASTEERIVFMTTNHLGRLDPALIRPGRVDVTEEVGIADAHQTELLFSRFYPEADETIAKEFARLCVLEGNELSVAELQGFLMCYKNKPQEAVGSVLDFTRHARQQRNKLEKLRQESSEFGVVSTG